jgi:hypothetical protein
MPQVIPNIGPSATPDPNLQTNLPNNIIDLATTLFTSFAYSSSPAVIQKLTADLQNIYDAANEGFLSGSDVDMQTIFNDVNSIASSYLNPYQGAQVGYPMYNPSIIDMLKGFSYGGWITDLSPAISISVLNTMMNWASDSTKYYSIKLLGYTLLGGEGGGSLLPGSIGPDLRNQLTTCCDKNNYGPTFITLCKTIINALPSSGNSEEKAS